MKTEPSTRPEHVIPRTQMHTSNYISVSTKGKLGYALIKDNFCWGLLMEGLVQRAITGSGSYKGPAQELCEAGCMLWSRQPCFRKFCALFHCRLSAHWPPGLAFFRVYWCLPLKFIDIICLREWWGKEVIVLVVKGKRMCLLGSRKNVSSFSVAEQGEGHSILMTTLTASFPNTETSVLFSPQHFSNSHQFTKVDGVLLYSAESSRR